MNKITAFAIGFVMFVLGAITGIAVEDKSSPWHSASAWNTPAPAHNPACIKDEGAVYEEGLCYVKQDGTVIWRIVSLTHLKGT